MQNSFVIITTTSGRSSLGETYFRGTLSQLGNPHTSVDLNDTLAFASARGAYKFATRELPRGLHGTFKVGRRPQRVTLPVILESTRVAAAAARARRFEELMA